LQFEFWKNIQNCPFRQQGPIENLQKIKMTKIVETRSPFLCEKPSHCSSGFTSTFLPTLFPTSFSSTTISTTSTTLSNVSSSARSSPSRACTPSWCRCYKTFRQCSGKMRCSFWPLVNLTCPGPML
jgi:hypothetical protein